MARPRTRRGALARENAGRVVERDSGKGGASADALLKRGRENRERGRVGRRVGGQKREWGQEESARPRTRC